MWSLYKKWKKIFIKEELVCFLLFLYKNSKTKIKYQQYHNKSVFFYFIELIIPNEDTEHRGKKKKNGKTYEKTKSHN